MSLNAQWQDYIDAMIESGHGDIIEEADLKDLMKITFLAGASAYDSELAAAVKTRSSRLVVLKIQSMCLEIKTMTASVGT